MCVYTYTSIFYIFVYSFNKLPTLLIFNAIEKTKIAKSSLAHTSPYCLDSIVIFFILLILWRWHTNITPLDSVGSFTFCFPAAPRSCAYTYICIYIYVCVPFRYIFKNTSLTLHGWQLVSFMELGFYLNQRLNQLRRIKCSHTHTHILLYAAVCVSALRLEELLLLLFFFWNCCWVVCWSTQLRPRKNNAHMFRKLEECGYM